MYKNKYILKFRATALHRRHMSVLLSLAIACLLQKMKHDRLPGSDIGNVHMKFKIEIAKQD